MFRFKDNFARFLFHIASEGGDTLPVVLESPALPPGITPFIRGLEGHEKALIERALK